MAATSVNTNTVAAAAAHDAKTSALPANSNPCLLEELQALLQIYNEGDLTVDRVNSLHWTLRLPEQSATLLLDFPDTYPHAAVHARVQQRQLTRAQLTAVNTSLAQCAQEQAAVGEPAVFAVALKAQSELTPLLLVSESAVKLACPKRDQQQQQQQHQQQQQQQHATSGSESGSEGEQQADTGAATGRKYRMRPAQDVVSRLKHDPEVPLDKMIVGYEDRFIGIVELPFTSFNWTDAYAALGPLDVAIPRHRIVHFKCQDRIIWDRRQRIDDVFGSTGGKKLHEVVAEMKLQVPAQPEEMGEEEEQGTEGYPCEVHVDVDVDDHLQVEEDEQQYDDGDL